MSELEQAFVEEPQTFEQELTDRLDKGYVPGSLGYRAWKDNVAWVMDHIAHLTAQAEMRGAEKLAQRLKRAFELGKLTTQERDFGFGAIDHELAALNPTDTQSRGEA